MSEKLPIFGSEAVRKEQTAECNPPEDATQDDSGDLSCRRHTYEVVPVGVQGDKEEFKRATRENVDSVISIREDIIRKFAIENPPEILTKAIVEAKKFITETLIQAGVSIAEGDIPEITLIDWEQKEALNQKISSCGGAIPEVRGASSVLNGVSVVFVRKDITNLDQASAICHEMLHSVGSQIIAANESRATYSRQGYEVFGMNSRYKPWLLEEGLMAYTAASFSESLSDDPDFSPDFIAREQKTKYLESIGDIQEGKISLVSGMKVEPRYFLLIPRGDNIKDAAYGLPSCSGLSGSLFELLMNKFDEQEKVQFLNVAHKSRIDLKMIPKLAKMIDSKWGKGTYVKLLKCDREESAIWEMILELQEKIQ